MIRQEAILGKPGTCGKSKQFMDSESHTIPHQERQAATIAELTALIAALQTALPSTKPWQRQLRTQLADIDSRLEVIRKTVALERDADFAEAAQQLVLSLREANQYGASGRADDATRAAVQLALRLASEIVRSTEDV